VDIDRLIKKRQLNVQEQNALVAHRLMVTAKAWLATGVPPALKNYGESKALDGQKPSCLTFKSTFPECHACMVYCSLTKNSSLRLKLIPIAPIGTWNR
jgi:hypothetical protein